MRRVAHRLRRGHWPEYFEMAGYKLCALCDLGTPRPALNPVATSS